MIKKLVKYFKNSCSVKGKYTNRASVFNKSDIVKFIMKLSVKYKNQAEKQKKVELFKKIDKYIYPILNYTLILSFFTYLMTIDTETPLITWNTLFIILVFRFLLEILYDIYKAPLKKETTMSINIGGYSADKKLMVDFNYYYDLSVKNKYRIIYNSCIRLFKKYENEDWADIEWGVDSVFKASKDPKYDKPNPRSQYKFQLGFYPKELIDLLYNTSLEIYDERCEYSVAQNTPYKEEHIHSDDYDNINYKNSKVGIPYEEYGMVNYRNNKTYNSIEIYIQNMSNSQLLELSKKIDNLELTHHELKK